MGLVPATGGRIVFDGADDHRPRRARHARRPPADAVRLPGPVLLAQPGACRVGEIVAEPLRIHGLYDDDGRRGAHRGAVRDGRPLAGDARALPARVLGRPEAAHRHRPRAGAASRACSSSTSRSPRSTSRSRPRSSICCRTCSASSASPICSSRTTSPWCATSRTASPSCISAASSRRARRRRSTRSRRIPIRNRCSPPCRCPIRLGAHARRRIVLQGEIPNPASPPAGCTFHPRCFRASARCAVEAPRFEPYPGLPTSRLPSRRPARTAGERLAGAAPRLQPLGAVS